MFGTRICDKYIQNSLMFVNLNCRLLSKFTVHKADCFARTTTFLYQYSSRFLFIVKNMYYLLSKDRHKQLKGKKSWPYIEQN